ncbi:hypothetical protein E4U30_000513 [Claviceps sp. LM220 group G6]|nr:hypothetical protein E4U15_006076 [Claviceps sp. LM218 group G6]KAG6096515.1 hypothetical protein E4U31_005421 [Claviceps sp. LM219 group G6]KAG6097585.1 hypothetical protein E4U30_000513 [Claviceps sp. LM220 group G6]KAG6107631.1 hypothetical protein E4U14_004081 [Claviceps sp. LM454 group G7]
MTPELLLRWLFALVVHSFLALRLLLHYTYSTLESVSGSRESEGQNSSIGRGTGINSKGLETERSGDQADRIDDASSDLVFVAAVESIPETSISRSSKASEDVTAARLVDGRETSGPQRRFGRAPVTFTGQSRLIRCANRPRNPRRPWLPRFPKLRRRINPRVCDLPSQDPSQRPSSRTFPNQTFLIDTVYPRLETTDQRQADIDNVLRSVRSLRLWDPPRRQAISSAIQSAPLRPVPNNVPLFVEINGICTKKRHAEDTEIDLVAALHCTQDESPPSCITTYRSPITSDSEVGYQNRKKEHMVDLRTLSRGVTGMMTNVISCLSDLGDRFRRYLYNQPSAVFETKSYAPIRLSTELHVASKRRRIALADSNFEWLDRDGLNVLISRYHQLRDCFQRSCDVVRNCPSRSQVNKILWPLLSVLANDDDDFRKLESGQDGYDLSSLYLLFCQDMFGFLDGVYEISTFIKVKDQYPTVPRDFQYTLTKKMQETVNRTKNLTSAPVLVPVLRDLLDEGNQLDDYTLPVDIIGAVALDMAAMAHDIIFPSFVKYNHFHRKLVEQFLPSHLRIWPFDEVPGTYPQGNPRASEPSYATKETRIGEHDVSRTISPSTPPPHIKRLERTKTAYLRAQLLANEVAQLTSAGFKAKFHGRDDTYESIKESYITDFVAKQPLQGHEIRAVKSILKDRKVPKRLTMQLAPKSVRFTESTFSPRQRGHLGLDVPRKLTAEEEIIRSEAQKELDTRAPASPEFKSVTADFKYMFPRGRFGTPLPKRKTIGITSSATIEKILALPSLRSLVISDDTKAGIEVKKERAARKAAEEANRLAEQQIRKEREERLVRTGGLRIPDQPLVAPLSSDWLSRAYATLRANASTILATTAEGVELRRHDFAKVVPPMEWLNDEIVNGSFNWLDQFINMAAGIKDTKKSTRKCLAMSSFFFKRLQEQGVTRTQRTLRRYGVDKENLLDVDTILLPICEHSHWTLLVIRPSKRTVAHIDSMSATGSQKYINVGLAWLKDLMNDQFVDSEWKVMLHEAPMQTNGYDCGMHTITNGMCIALGLNPIDSYVAEDMPRQRLRIASMLLNGGFKGDFDLRRY